MDIETKSIKGREYQIYYMPPKKAIKILSRLLKIVGKGISGALSTANTETTTEKFFDQEINIGGLVEGLIERLDENSVLSLIDELLVHVEIDNGEGNFRKINFEQDFHRKLADLFLVLKEVIVINYADFFGEASATAKAGAGTKKKK